MFISPTCGTCLELADQMLDRPATAMDALINVVGDTRSPEFQALREKLDPLTRSHLVVGESARLLMRGLAVGALPYGVLIDRDVVRASRYLRTASDIDKLRKSTVMEGAKKT